MFNENINVALLISLFKKFKVKSENIIDRRLNRVDIIVEELNDYINSNRFLGLPGKDGTNGKDGIDGKDGLPGNDGKNGRDGIDGLPGKDGLPGINGTDGTNGKDGRDGLDGKDGLPGADGRDGKDGIDGLNGKDGIPGLSGTNGLPGADGRDGKDGIDGLPGLSGKDGRDGKDGKDGVDGKDGKDSDITPLKEDINNFINNIKLDLESLNENVSSKVESFKYDTEKTNIVIQENVRKYISDNEKNIKDFKNQIYHKMSIGWGEGTPGGSVRILDNEDVEFKRRHQIEGDAILIFDAAKQKFVSESIQSVMDRIQMAVESQYNKLIEVDGANTYIGEALPGTDPSSSGWRIKKIEEINTITEIYWANGTAEFDKVWDDKLTYNYN